MMMMVVVVVVVMVVVERGMVLVELPGNSQRLGNPMPTVNN